MLVAERTYLIGMYNKDNRLIYEEYDIRDKPNMWADEHKKDVGSLHHWISGKKDQQLPPWKQEGSQIIDTLDKVETLIRKLYKPHLDQQVVPTYGYARDTRSAGPHTQTRYLLHHGEVPLDKDAPKDHVVFEWEGMFRVGTIEEPEYWHPDDTMEDRMDGSDE